MNPFAKKTTPIGLDVGHDSIKMLQLAPMGAGLTAIASARWQFPENVQDDPAARRRLAAEAVRELLVSGGFKGRQVVSCLGGDDLTIKQIRLPRMSQRERDAAVLWEANERFGFKVEPDQLFHCVAGEIRQGAEVRDEIILMGVRAEAVEAHLAMLDQMKLTVLAIDAEPACLFRSFERFLRRAADTSSVTVLIEIGASATRVLIARGRSVSFVKNIDIGGRNLTRAVAETLGLSQAEAAQLRLRHMHGYDDEPAAVSTGQEQVTRALYDAIRPTVEQLAHEISLCLRYYAVTFRGEKPQSIALLGGEAYDQCMRKLLNENLNIECAVGRPLHQVDLSLVDLGANRRGMLSEWAVPAGLALRGLPVMRAQEQADGPDRLSA